MPHKRVASVRGSVPVGLHSMSIGGVVNSGGQLRRPLVAVDSGGRF